LLQWASFGPTTPTWKTSFKSAEHFKAIQDIVTSYFYWMICYSVEMQMTDIHQLKKDQ